MPDGTGSGRLTPVSSSASVAGEWQSVRNYESDEESFGVMSLDSDDDSDENGEGASSTTGRARPAATAAPDGAAPRIASQPKNDEPEYETLVQQPSPSLTVQSLASRLQRFACESDSDSEFFSDSEPGAQDAPPSPSPGIPHPEPQSTPRAPSEQTFARDDAATPTIQNTAAMPPIGWAPGFYAQNSPLSQQLPPLASSLPEYALPGLAVSTPSFVSSQPAPGSCQPAPFFQPVAWPTPQPPVTYTAALRLRHQNSQLHDPQGSPSSSTGGIQFPQVPQHQPSWGRQATQATSTTAAASDSDSLIAALQRDLEEPPAVESSDSSLEASCALQSNGWDSPDDAWDASAWRAAERPWHTDAGASPRTSANSRSQAQITPGRLSDVVAAHEARNTIREVKEIIKALRNMSEGNPVMDSCNQINFVLINLRYFMRDLGDDDPVDTMIPQWLAHAQQVLMQVREILQHHPSRNSYMAMRTQDETRHLVGMFSREDPEVITLLAELRESKDHFMGLFSDFCKGSIVPDATDVIDVQATREALATLHEEVQASLAFISSMSDTWIKKDGWIRMSALEESLSMILVSLAAGCVAWSQDSIPRHRRITSDTLDIARAADPTYFMREADEFCEAREPLPVTGSLDEDAKAALLVIMLAVAERVMHVLFPFVSDDSD